MENSRLTIAPIDQTGAAVLRNQDFYQVPQVILDDLCEAAIDHMDKVIVDDYEIDPDTKYHFVHIVEPGPPKDRLIKINNPHVVARTLLELIAYPLIGQWAASGIGGADKRCRFGIPNFFTSLLAVPQKATSVFFRDYTYWQFFDSTEGLFTTWIPLSRVKVASGAMRFPPGFHPLATS